MNGDIQLLQSELLALPVSQRAILAQALWGSLDGSYFEMEDSETFDEADRRNLEMLNEQVTCLTHEELLASLGLPHQ